MTNKHISFSIIVFLFFLPHFSQDLKIKKINLKNFPEIELTLSIENKWGTPIPLDIKNMKLYENKREVFSFKTKVLDSVQVPVYTVIIIDKSGSMKGDAIKMAKKGAIWFVKMMKGADKTAYIEFDTNVDVITDFLMEKQKVELFINGTAVGSDTAFLDALYTGLELLKKAPQNSVKIVLALTDGRENKSKKKLSEIISLANLNETPIYTIGLGNNIDEPMLKKIAKQTQGNFYEAPKPEQLIEIYKKISLLLHSQLIITYKTAFGMDNKWHPLKLTIPYMGTLIESEKSYLSAKKSRISTELLWEIRLESQRIELQKTIQIKKLRKEEQKNKVDNIIYILFSILIALLILLIIVLIRKRG